MRKFCQDNWAYFIAAMIVVCTLFQCFAYVTVGTIGPAIVLCIVMFAVAGCLIALKKGNLV